MTTNKFLVRFAFIFYCTFILGLACFTHQKIAQAATHVNGYQITVKESVSTMNYGDPAPYFSAQLTIPADETGIPNSMSFYIIIDSQVYAGKGYVSSNIFPTSYSLDLHLAEISGTPLPVGQHSVVAVYFSNKLGTRIESTPLKLTILKGSPGLDCFISNLDYTYAPDAPLTLTINTSTSTDLQNETDTISFVGARTFTTANLKPNSASQVTIPTPSVTGNYKLRCIFNGSNSFNAAEEDMGVTVSKNYQPGIKLYTNPTTLKPGQPVTWYIVVSGAAGLPTPTGTVSIRLGSSYTNSIALGSDGTLSLQGTAPPLTDTVIRVSYYGDVVYKPYTITFPLTNPSIPTNGGNPSSTGSSNSAQPLHTGVAKAAITPSPVPNPTSNVGSTSTPIAASGIGAGNSTAGNGAAKPLADQGNTGGWIASGVLVALASSGVVGFVVLRKRSVIATAKKDTNN